MPPAVAGYYAVLAVLLFGVKLCPLKENLEKYPALAFEVHCNTVVSVRN